MKIILKNTFFYQKEVSLTMVRFGKQVYAFYRDGFRSMVLGRTLWKIIAIKLFVLFVLLKLFFFPNYLNTNFNTDQERAGHVLQNLTAGFK